MTKENWKTLRRNQRIAARKIGAATYRIARKLIRVTSADRYAAKLALQARVHVEITPAMAQLAKAQEALDNLSLA